LPKRIYELVRDANFLAIQDRVNRIKSVASDSAPLAREKVVNKRSKGAFARSVFSHQHQPVIFDCDIPCAVTMKVYNPKVRQRNGHD
jgi:hypothetical protein